MLMGVGGVCGCVVCIEGVGWYGCFFVVCVGLFVLLDCVGG